MNRSAERRSRLTASPASWILTALIAAPILAGCSDRPTGFFDGTPYTGEIQPTSVARVEPPPAPEGEEGEGASAPAPETPSEPREAPMSTSVESVVPVPLQEVAPPMPQRSPAGNNPAEDILPPPAQPRTALTGPGPDSGSVLPDQPTVATASEPPPRPPEPEPKPAEPPESVAEPAPPPQPMDEAEPAPDAEAAEAPTPAPLPPSLPRPPSEQTYPNLADVPERPTDIPSPEERERLLEELQSDRAASGLSFGAAAEQAAPDGEGEETTEPAPVPDQPTPEPRFTPDSASGEEAGTVYFESGQADLGVEELAVLDRIAEAHAAQGGEIRVVGHAASGAADAVGTETVPAELSRQRAQSVADALVQRGVDRSSIWVSGAADTQPASGPAEARRVQIYLDY
ncbi:OmpA family protein [Inquilinus sp. CAU 1745]|uniref:OmpA family protein n=1 Tax=Inquilinus sp. CAU 1745 TaxID=3140369 RepID=UPI00325C3261